MTTCNRVRPARPAFRPDLSALEERTLLSLAPLAGVPEKPIAATAEHHLGFHPGASERGGGIAHEPSGTPTPIAAEAHAHAGRFHRPHPVKRHHGRRHAGVPGSNLVSAPGSTPGSSTNVNQAVLNYAQSHLGQQVGDGQCATLAYDAESAAGAVPYYRLGPSGPNDAYVWGSLVATLTSPTSSTANIQPGDIIQFGNATFVQTIQNPDGSSETITASADHHTAIVTSVSGTTINVLQQNVESSTVAQSLWMTVQAGTIDISGLQPGGTLWVYSPLASSS